MAQSNRYRELQRRVREVRDHLLPRTFSATGEYSDRVYDRARAFRLMVHAELEACIEDLVLETVDAACGFWAVDGKPRETLIALLAHDAQGFGGPPPTLPISSPSEPLSLRGRVDIARRRFSYYVRTQNNGIRESNVLALLLPAGVRESQIEPLWLADIDSFGRLRGETAHQGKRTQQPLDPRDEHDRANGLVSRLGPIDALLQTLSR
jgi:hypothetical protein